MGFGEKDKGNSVEYPSKEKIKEIKNTQEKTKKELDNLKKILNIGIKDNPYFQDPYYQKASNLIGNWAYGATPESDIKAYAEKLRSKDKGYIKEDDVWIIASWGNKFFEGLPLKTYNTFVDLYHKRIDGKMTKEEIDFKENVAQNIYPWGYGVFWKIQDLVKNKKEYTKDKVQKMWLGMQVRIDMFRKYMWLDTYSNFIEQSKYIPSQSTEKTIYYDFNETLKKKIILDIKKKTTMDGFQFILDKHKDKSGREWLYENILDGWNVSSGILTWALAHYRTWVGYDAQKKEKYISYYDIRDLDPPRIKENWIDIDRYNFPFEIYGRIYESDFNTVQK